MTIDIFAKTKESTIPTWATFKVAGDNAQGTYVGKIVGLIDGYGNKQIVYQLLQDDESVLNVGFGLNKKVIHEEMNQVRFGQIIGFKYKGMVTYQDKRTGKDNQVKDFGFYQDSKIVNEKWLTEHKDNMPTVSRTTNNDNDGSMTAEEEAANKAFDDLGEKDKSAENDVPFSSKDSKTNEDKLAEIEKFAIDKLGATNSKTAKEKVMEVTEIAFIPVNYDRILEKLAAQ